MNKIASACCIAVMVTLLAGCSIQTPDALSTPTATSLVLLQSTPTQVPATETMVPTTSPTVTIEPQVSPTEPAVSPTPFVEYQLTYTQPHFDAQRWVDYDRLYAVDIGCLSSDQPCFGEPYLLLETWVESRTHDKPVGRILSYSWSPDGTKLALSGQGVDGPGDIFVLDMSSQIWRNLTRSPEGESYPSWSPDGQSIAFIIQPQPPLGGNNWVSMVDMQGKATQLFELDQDLSYLAWMPDGNEIGFSIRDSKGYWQLGRANLDGSDLLQITHLETDSISPSFSFGNPLMVFDRKVYESNSVNYHHDLFWLNLDTYEEGQIAAEVDKWETDPAFAPNGKWIAFESGKDVSGGTNIYLVTLDGLNMIQVTQGGGYTRDLPSWRVLSNP